MNRRNFQKCTCELGYCRTTFPKQEKHTGFDNSDHYNKNSEHKLTLPSLNQFQTPQKKGNYHFGNTFGRKENKDNGRRIKTEHHVSFKDNVGRQIHSDQIPFRGSSIFKDEYRPSEEIQSLKRINPQNKLFGSLFIPNQAKFQGESRYKEDYIDSPQMHNIRVLSIGNRNQTTQRNKIPESSSFIQGTSYISHYKPYKIKLDKPQTPKKSLNHLLLPKFQGISNYKDHFRKFIVQLNPKCRAQILPIPYRNYTKNRHMYYDEANNSFS